MNQPDVISNIESKHWSLPFDDIETYPYFHIRVLKTVWMLLSKPVTSLKLIFNPTSKCDPFNYTLVIMWPISCIQDLIKLLLSYSEWLRNFSIFRFLPEFHETVGWTLFSILFTPIGLWIGFWIVTFFNHCALWIWRSLYNEFNIKQTARAFGFTYPTIALINIPISLILLFIFKGLVPRFAHVTSSILGMALSLTYIGLAISEIHRIPKWRGILASITFPSLIVITGVAIKYRDTITGLFQ